MIIGCYWYFLLYSERKDSRIIVIIEVEHKCSIHTYLTSLTKLV